ncbi:TetR family transcriptional regulator [Nocardia arthritidis]|uniref:TetR family transcriptional regulator n=1 Tax=Nocardia arthritidis TaxID=228602 RepID=A0A6G9YMS1_9NOCA|nr:TetR family transcriptional regulator [Nocardia arthritidis]QIS14492.1 TetR family transcriptional regulator [Nocardia arthritidis]
MSSQPSDDMPPAQGLRERKKARTKAAIQREAVRLFREQGYGATTVEQVAAAAEVAPSTVFRYFPTKQDLVIDSDYDHVFEVMMRGQSPDLSPNQAEHKAIHDILAEMTDEELAVQRDRLVLILSVPELWGASLGSVRKSMAVIAEQAAKRRGGDPADPRIRAYSGAAFGIMLMVGLDWTQNPEMDFASALEQALTHLPELDT